MSKHNSSGGIIAGAIVGGAVGAVAALLLAPKSGEELRSDLGKQLRTVGERAKELASSIYSTTQEVAGSIAAHTKEAAGTVAEHTKEAAGSVAEHTKEAVDSVAGHATEAATGIGSHAKEAAQEVQEAVEGVKSDLNSMAPLKDDIAKLGKEMDAMPTNSELERQGLRPDPAQ